MALEVATTIAGLVATNPVAGDPVPQGDDHLRLIKTVLKATPFIVDRAYGEYTTNADISSIIPYDDTIPQSTEGTQIISVSITPKSTTNRLRLRFQGTVNSSVSAVNVIAAMFNSGSANALRANSTTTAATAFNAPLILEYEYVPGSTSAQTFNIRVGSTDGTAFRLNGTGAGRIFGGAMAATLVIDEIQA